MKFKANINIDINVDDTIWGQRATLTKEEFVDNFKAEMVDELKHMLDNDQDGINVDVTCEAEFID